MVILEFLGWGMKRDNESKARKQLMRIIFSGDLDPVSLGYSITAFSEVYVLIFHMFDLEWKNAKVLNCDSSFLSYLNRPSIWTFQTFWQLPRVK
jgi:hypothetical protein